MRMLPLSKNHFTRRLEQIIHGVKRGFREGREKEGIVLGVKVLDRYVPRPAKAG
jgi:hypothetical protein